MARRGVVSTYHVAASGTLRAVFDRRPRADVLAVPPAAGLSGAPPGRERKRFPKASSTDTRCCIILLTRRSRAGLRGQSSEAAPPGSASDRRSAHAGGSHDMMRGINTGIATAALVLCLVVANSGGPGRAQSAPATPAPAAAQNPGATPAPVSAPPAATPVSP